MFIKKHYKVRHLILKILVDHDNSFKPSATFEEKKLHFKDICQKLPQFDKTFLLDNLDYLSSVSKEIFCSMEFDNSRFAIIAAGRHAYIEGKYLLEGKKEFRNLFDQKIRIISTIILLLIALSTFIINIVQTQKNRAQIEEIKSQLQNLQDQKNK
jgi:hypothetical protein